MRNKMTWHLKDRELEEKLIAIDPEFVDKLQIKEGCGNYGFYLDLGGCVYCGDVGVPKIQVYFVQEDLEEVPEYNPHGWNEYPKVKPPKHEPLRVEFADKSGTKAFFDDCLREYVTAKRIDSPCRYRPWED